MHDWLLELQSGQRVLDLCSGTGSFSPARLACTAIALDEDPAAFQYAAPLTPGPYYRALGVSDQIPFSDASFDLVILHHGLEHIPGPEKTLREVGRVLKPDGRLVVSIPNGYGLCDGIYRFVFEGGGHVNRFTRQRAVELVEQCAGVHLQSWHNLYSSFAYLYRLAEALDTRPMSLPNRARAFGKLPRSAVYGGQRALYRTTRLADRLFHTNLAVYGWAFYFSHSGHAVREQPAYLNVCVYCGSGHPAADIDRSSASSWRCSACNTMNPFVKPFRNAI
ncbi:MAG TPA: methyltransferase domain-containing protein [Bryobacteraceae bacterium]|jgi:SAM-dependent methyltransferase|nr:methyltransferase domain-containing protein [Bryobacteraceae bacterium]